MKVIDETGNIYGRLEVQEHTRNRLGQLAWKCLCECGETAVVFGNNLRSGDIKSCGCLKAEVDREKCIQLIVNNKTHGHYMRGKPTPTYLSWQGMIQRCTNPQATGYFRYGGAGVRVCAEWMTFTGFLQSIGERPEGTTLGRIMDMGNYEKGNAFWMTPAEQGLAQRDKRALLKWAA